jgi:hypothetical protein
MKVAAHRRCSRSSPGRRSCASSSARAIAERCRPIAIGSGRAGGSARAITERPDAVAVGRDRAGGPAAGVAERSLVLCRRCRDHDEREHGDVECLHCLLLPAAEVQRDGHRLRCLLR